MTTAMRIANGFLCIFFAYATVLQLNDPDSAKWMAMYSSASITCLLGAALPTSKITNADDDSSDNTAQKRKKELLRDNNQKQNNKNHGGGVWWTPLQAVRTLILVCCLFALSLRYYQAGWMLDLDYKTEDGRENSGMIIVAWAMLINMVSMSRTVAIGIVGLAVSVCASAIIIPRYLMTMEHMQGHCHGIGFEPVSKQ